MINRSPLLLLARCGGMALGIMLLVGQGTPSMGAISLDDDIESSVVLGDGGQSTVLVDESLGLSADVKLTSSATESESTTTSTSYSYTTYASTSSTPSSDGSTVSEGDVTLLSDYSGDSSGLVGDVNGDGVVDFNDYMILEANYGKTGATTADGDLNGDGVVNFTDYQILEENYGNTLVPEPSSLAVWAIIAVAGAIWGYRRSRRNCRRTGADIGRIPSMVALTGEV